MWPFTSHSSGRKSFIVFSFFTATIMMGCAGSTRRAAKAIWNLLRILWNWSAILRASFSPALVFTVKCWVRTSIQLSAAFAATGARKNRQASAPKHERRNPQVMVLRMLTTAVRLSRRFRPGGSGVDVLTSCGGLGGLSFRLTLTKLRTRLAKLAVGLHESQKIHREVADGANRFSIACQRSSRGDSGMVPGWRQ